MACVSGSTGRACAFRFGTVGCPASAPKKPGGSLGAVLRLAALGLDALELGWVQSVRVTAETCALIRAAAQENDVHLSVHAPYYINLNASPAEWPKSRQRLMAAAHYGSLAGASDIVFHPGSYFGAAPQAVLPLSIQRLAGCVEELRQAGNPVRLRPETMGKAAMLGSLEDVLALSRAVQGVQPCLDFAHLHARPGDGSVNSYDEWMRVLDRVGQVLGQPALQQLHIHLSGIAYGPKGEKEHLRLKDSDIDLPGLYRALQAQGCRGRILCESPAMEDDALELRRVWVTVGQPQPAPCAPALDRTAALAALHARLSACRLCLETGYQITPRAIFCSRIGARLLVIGQAPGITEPVAGRPFNAGSGKRLFQWLGQAGLEEDWFRSTQAFAAVTRCYPGRSSAGSGDRVPTPAEQRLCRPYLDEEIALLAPGLIIPVGRLAIGLYYPPNLPLEQIIGSEKQVDGRWVIPLPHPSGASRWHQIEANRMLIRQALERIARRAQEALAGPA